MSAYVIVDLVTRDPEALVGYRQLVPATIARYGGRYLVRGGEHAVLEGDWTPSRIVVLEFPSVEQARLWYDSEEYRPLKEIRLAAADSALVLVAGVDG